MPTRRHPIRIVLVLLFVWAGGIATALAQTPAGWHLIEAPVVSPVAAQAYFDSRPPTAAVRKNGAL